MKLIGLISGIPDYWVLLKNYKIAAIEFKTDTGKLSQQQQQIGVLLQSHPLINYKICRSSNEAVEFIKQLY